MSNIPNSLIRQLQSIAKNIDAAQLHVLDGMQDGQQHHYDSAKELVDEAKDQLESAMSTVDTYLKLIEEGVPMSKAQLLTQLAHCDVCGKVATLREVGGGAYYCSRKCQEEKYGINGGV